MEIQGKSEPPANEPRYMLHHEGMGIGEVHVRGMEEAVAGASNELVLEAKDRSAAEWIRSWRETAPEEARTVLIQEVYRDQWVRVEGASLREVAGAGEAEVQLRVHAVRKLEEPVYQPPPW